MLKLVVLLVLFSVVSIQIVECFYRPEKGPPPPPPPKPLDIQIYGKSVKLNIYEIHLGNDHGKEHELIRRLREQLSINRRKRSADSNENSVINSATNMLNKARDSMKNLADKAKSMVNKAKSTFENVKSSISG